MKKCLLYQLSLLLLAFAGCKDTKIENPFTLCPDEATYTLDYRATLLEDGLLWLSEADGDIGFEERLAPILSPSPQQFFNFQDACAEAYTLSLALFPIEQELNEELAATDLDIQEFAALPSGTLLDRSNNQLLFGSFVGNNQIEIWNAPPVDQVQLLARTVATSGAVDDLVIEHRYPPGNDNLLVLETQAADVLSNLGLLVLRLAGTQEAVGAYLDLREGYPLLMNYDQFFPLANRSLAISWPPQATDQALEVSWVNDLLNQQQLLLAKLDGPEEMSIPVPPDATGPFVITARWRSEAEYEVQYVYHEWPANITLDPVVAGEVNSFQYPELEYEVALASIMVLAGEIGRPQSGTYGRRRYVTPTLAGVHRVRLPSFSPALTQLGEELPSLYQRTFTEGGRLSVWYYPAMNGSYDWYLRHIYANRATADAWLPSLEYERVTIGL